MKKLGLFIATAVMLVLFAFSASAETEWYYTYIVKNGEATITAVDESISGDVTIPSTLGGYKVTAIGDNAFYYCTKLTSITTPDGVTSIGEGSFENCKNLTSISIPDSVTSIGSYAFYNCKNLTSITIPDSVTSIGDYTFSDCTSFTNVTIPDSVTSIGEGSFANCKNLTSISIPDSVTSIGSYAFYNCKNLTSITIPDGVTIIDFSAFKGCTGLTNITIPDGVTHIGDKAFSGCSDLTSITIPDSVTYIGYGAFYNCKSLTSITIPDGVTIPHDVSSLHDTFSGCSSLTSVTIPDGVSSLYGTFSGCSSLTSITIPDSVTCIGDKAFSGCSDLTSITIPNDVKNISDYAFYNCKSLTSITIGDGVTSIGDYTFAYCTSLVSITIPDSVKAIGNQTFCGCTGLIGITIPDSVKSIGYNAFYNCSKITDVYYTGTKSQWNAIRNDGGNAALTNATIHYNSNGPVHKNIVDIPQQDPTCTKIGYTSGKQCSDCKEWISGHETIAKLGHSYSSSYTTDKKATLSANGSRSKHCTRDGCTAKTSVTAIARVSSVTLSKTNYIYDGKNKTPKVTVKDAEGNTLVKNVDYKLSVASKRSGIGKYTVKVTFMGNYSGSKSVYFYIKPGKTDSVKSAAQTVSSIKLSWSKVPGAAGYTVYRYSPSKKAYVKAGTTEGTTLTVKSLYSGTKYTFRVVAYGKTSAGKVYDSDSYALLKTATKTKTPILSDITAYKGKVKLFWTATSGETGYTVYYSTKKDSGFKKYANYESNSGYVTGLTSGKTYYFKVRTYIKTNSGYVYSDWSNIKGVKVK